MKNNKIAVLISGKGSNLEALINGAVDGNFQVACAISNNRNAFGMEIAKKFKIPAYAVDSGPSMEDEILRILKDSDVALVCLAGFMKVLSRSFVEQWNHKILNIHPSLLPSFKGLNAQAQALRAKVKIAGCTVHFVTPELDSGAIIMQGAVPVLSDDTEESLSLRILQVEHHCYWQAVRGVLHHAPVKEYLFVDTTL